MGDANTELLVSLKKLCSQSFFDLPTKIDLGRLAKRIHVSDSTKTLAESSAVESLRKSELERETGNDSSSHAACLSRTLEKLSHALESPNNLPVVLEAIKKFENSAGLPECIVHYLIFHYPYSSFSSRLLSQYPTQSTDTLS